MQQGLRLPCLETQRLSVWPLQPQAAAAEENLKDQWCVMHPLQHRLVLVLVLLAEHHRIDALVKIGLIQLQRGACP